MAVSQVSHNNMQKSVCMDVDVCVQKNGRKILKNDDVGNAFTFIQKRETFHKLMNLVS